MEYVSLNKDRDFFALPGPFEKSGERSHVSEAPVFCVAAGDSLTLTFPSSYPYCL